MQATFEFWDEHKITPLQARVNFEKVNDTTVRFTLLDDVCSNQMNGGCIVLADGIPEEFQPKHPLFHIPWPIMVQGKPDIGLITIQGALMTFSGPIRGKGWTACPHFSQGACAGNCNYFISG